MRALLRELADFGVFGRMGRVMAPTDRFTATLYRIGMNYCVDVPPHVSTGWDARHVPVQIVVVGLVGRTTAMRRKDGGYRVFVNVSLREMSDLRDGDAIDVRVTPTEELSEPDVPTDLERALAGSKVDRDAWTGLTLRQRRDFVRYLGEAKGAETRQKRLTRGLQTIRKKK